MSAREGAIIGCALLLALAACSRRLPTPSAESMIEPPASSEAAPVELAGGPPAPATPAEASVAPDQPLTPAAPDAAPATPDAAVTDSVRPVAGEASDGLGPRDPLEPVNRRLYAVDRAVGRVIAHRPKLVGAEEPHAKAVVSAAGNVLDNLDEPSVAANDLLQLKIGKALKAAVRFVINSTVGVAGVSDVAGRFGLKRHDNGLDVTLAKYGAPAGPYLYLPIAGPTTLRAAVGSVAESYLYPPHWLHLAAGIGAALRGAGYARLAQMALNHADTRQFAETRRDAYARTRQAYFDARAAQVSGGGSPSGRPTTTALASNQEPLH